MVIDIYNTCEFTRPEVIKQQFIKVVDELNDLYLRNLKLEKRIKKLEELLEKDN